MYNLMGQSNYFYSITIFFTSIFFYSITTTTMMINNNQQLKLVYKTGKELKKLWNMKVTPLQLVSPIRTVISALGKSPKDWYRDWTT